MLGGWTAAVAEQGAAIIDEVPWEQLCGRMSPPDCRVLAWLAAAALKGNNWLHKQVGSVAEALAARAGLGGRPRRFASALGERLPLPQDADVAATARGLQVTGILVCVSAGRDLRECRCFVDLAVDETKERVKQLLEVATRDWVQLA